MVSDTVLGLSILVFSLITAYGTIFITTWQSRSKEDERDSSE